MGQLLFGQKKKVQLYPKLENRYGLTTKTTTKREKKMRDLARWENIARKLKKGHPNWPQTVEEIAAELYNAEQQRKKK